MDLGSSTDLLIVLRKVTASRPSTSLWSYVNAKYIMGRMTIWKCLLVTVGIWNSTIWNPDFLTNGFQMVLLSNGQVVAMAMAMKTGPVKIEMFLSEFQMVFDKMAPICPDFKWLGIRISDPIRNPDYLQPNLF